MLRIEARPRDLGGFEVARLLPFHSRRLVGPFIFFDHIGPSEFPAGSGMDVRPHPHIGLATVTYLFEGKIRHKDSLGSDLDIGPGAVNWMTAGRGIAHSERTPPDLRASGHRLHGIQSWVALPKADEECPPDFVHHPADTLPSITLDGARRTLIAGTAFGAASPVKFGHPTFYIDVEAEAGATVHLPHDAEREQLMRGIYQGVKADKLDLARSDFAQVAQAMRVRHGDVPLIMGCTEIPLALPGAAEVAGLPLVDPAWELARALAAVAYGSSI